MSLPDMGKLSHKAIIFIFVPLFKKIILNR